MKRNASFQVNITCIQEKKHYSLSVNNVFPIDTPVHIAHGVAEPLLAFRLSNFLDDIGHFTVSKPEDGFH